METVCDNRYSQKFITESNKPSPELDNVAMRWLYPLSVQSFLLNSSLSALETNILLVRKGRRSTITGNKRRLNFKSDIVRCLPLPTKISLCKTNFLFKPCT